MIKIYVKNEEQKKYAAKKMDHELLWNSGLSGADYEIEIDQDQSPSIHNIDELVGAQLMNVVFKSEYEGFEDFEEYEGEEE